MPPGVQGIMPAGWIGSRSALRTRQSRQPNLLLNSRARSSLLYTGERSESWHNSLGTSLGEPIGAWGSDASARGAGYFRQCGKGGDHEL